MQAVGSNCKWVVAQIRGYGASLDLGDERSDIGLAFSIACEPVRSISIAVGPFGARPKYKGPFAGIGIELLASVRHRSVYTPKIIFNDVRGSGAATPVAGNRQ